MNILKFASEFEKVAMYSSSQSTENHIQRLKAIRNRLGSRKQMSEQEMDEMAIVLNVIISHLERTMKKNTK